MIEIDLSLTNCTYLPTHLFYFNHLNYYSSYQIKNIERRTIKCINELKKTNLILLKEKI